MLTLPLMLEVVGVEETKVAVTDSSLSMSTTQAPLPEQAPPQLEKRNPADGVGVKVT
jgi:hypothetical protein